MLTPARGLIALGVAFTAGLSLILVVVDPDDSTDGQRIETATDATESSSSVAVDPGTEDRPLLVAMADPGNRTILAVDTTGDDDDEAEDDERDDDAALAQPREKVTLQVDTGGATPAPDTSAAAPASSATTPTAARGTTPTAPASTAGTTTGSPSSAATSTPSSRAATAGTSTTANGTKATASSGSAGSSTSGTPATSKATTTTKATTAAPTSQPTTAPVPVPSGSADSGAAFEPIRNRDPLFNRYEKVPESGISLDSLTIPAPAPDNGGHPDGNFRMACNYSHFSYDDPIVFPGQPGKSHLHMFFGNTKTNAYSTTNSLVNSGGGSCQGFELNRSGYWTPAVLDGKGNIVVPDQIILYYKTKDPSTTVAMPQGLKMVAGNPRSESFTAGQKLGWSCGASGSSYNTSNRIPNNCGSDPINAYIQFPFCWDGKNLDSADHMSHMTFVNDNQSCPGSHPVRLPQITILLYYPPGSTSGWYLSSDRSNGFNTGPGATLHADWFGGWNDAAMDLWIDGCIRASRNCSYGQTGTSRMFARLNAREEYTGPNFLPLP